MQPAMAILLTRPKDGADRFADALRCEISPDVEIIISPLTRIDWLEQSLNLDKVRRLVFTSINGVRAFVRLSERRDIPCYTVGDATAAFAESHGMQATSCQGTAVELIARILADRERGPVLHIRGVHGRGAVVENLIRGGCKAQEVVTYRQMAEQLNVHAKQLLLQENPVIIPLFSPRGAMRLVDQSEGKAPLLVVALSEEVAKAARDLGAKQVIVAQRPDARAMVGAVKRLLNAERLY